MPANFDVAVIGSGPAGAACALRLTRMGFSVALMDKQTFPRPKLCGEYLNLGTLQELDDLGLRESLASQAAPLSGMRLWAHGETAEFVFSKSAWSLPRMILDNRIRSEAIAEGVVAITGQVRNLVKADTKTSLEFEREGERSVIHARYVVGADGLHSTVAKLMGVDVRSRATKFAVGGHHVWNGASGWIDMFAEKNGYLAINPLHGQQCNSVFVLERYLLRDNSQELGGYLCATSHRLTKDRHRIGADWLSSRYSIGPLAHRTSSMTHGNTLLVGDAAAFVDPFTGQGIFLALLGARHAAAALASALHRPQGQFEAFEVYQRTMRSILRQRDVISQMVKLILANPALSQRAAKTLRRKPDRFDDLIGAVCGDLNITFPRLLESSVRLLV